jgi:hypothetical protein
VKKTAFKASAPKQTKTNDDRYRYL